MTYLETVNKILRRLRERQVSTVEETTYSSLIGLYVNDAMQAVEEAWKWSSLRTTLTATTTSGIFAYELNGSQNNFTVLDVINDSDNFFMQYREAHMFNNFFLNSEPSTGSPYYYSFNGISSDGDTLVDVYPIPDKAYTIRFNVIQRTPELTDDADKIEVPAKAVELLAYAMAVEERGEDGGINPISAYSVANSFLTDAITLDTGKHPEEILWAAP
jgi:hypothetical protein|tara:strand:+ start:1415 stop:2062 length:648 start_codon:yes stop_codon:yes gene_type:complete